KILSFVGGREYHTENDEDQNNYATSTLRSNGSTMKPLLAYGPAMELGKVQPGTPIADLDIGDYDYIPSNYGKGHHGIVSARKGLEQSYNVVAAKVYQDIMHQDNMVEKFLSKMGFTSLLDNEYANASLAIGGT